MNIQFVLHRYRDSQAAHHVIQVSITLFPIDLVNDYQPLLAIYDDGKRSSSGR